jgi:sugar phosphate isomerase/epimerase
MLRPITLYTGQWGDLPLEEICRKARAWGFDGVELGEGGDHFDVPQALEKDSYVRGRLDLFEKYGLKCWAVSAHVAGQAVCDYPLDERHRRMLLPRLWGDGNEEGIRRRCAEQVQNTALAAAKMGVQIVTAFTGSRIWYMVAGFPPVWPELIAAGYRDFADRWNPILDVYDQAGVKFALEVHPTEIAFDFWTTKQTLAAIGRRPAFGINLDPSHLHWQSVDPVAFAYEFRDRIYHVHVKDSARNHDGRNGALGSLLPFGDERRGWDFVSPGRGGVAFENLFRALDKIGYDGPLSIEWEDNGMNREQGAPEALALVRHLAIVPPDVKFEDSYDRNR